MTELGKGGRAAGDAESLWKRSQTAFKRRDYALAAELMQTLLDRFGEDAAPCGAAALRLTLGVTLLRLKRTEAGVEHLRRATELDPGVGRAHQKLGAGLARLRLHEEALAAFERAVALCPDEAEFRWRFGEQLRRVGRPKEARAQFARCLELHPGHPAAAKSAAELEEAQGDDWLSRLRRTVGLG